MKDNSESGMVQARHPVILLKITSELQAESLWQIS